MRTAYRPISDGAAGIAEIVAQLNAARAYYGALPCVRAAALVIARPAADNDNAGNVAALARFVRAHVRYVTDPVNAELTQTPDVLLLAIHRDGAALGDCDDAALLFASLCESLGIACPIVAVSTPGAGRFDHVIAAPWIDGRQMQIDLTDRTGQDAAYSEIIA